VEKEIRYEVGLFEAGEFADSFYCPESTLVEIKRLLVSELSESDSRRELLLRCHHFRLDKVEKVEPVRGTPLNTVVFITCGVIAGMATLTCALIFGIGLTTITGWLWP
jgi:hypothetical protein